MASSLLHILFIYLLISASDTTQETDKEDTERLAGDKVRDREMEKQERGSTETEAKVMNVVTEVSAPPYYPAQNTTAAAPTWPGIEGGEKEGQERRLTNAKEKEEDAEQKKNPVYLNATFATPKNLTKPKIYFCGTPDLDETMREDEKQATNHTRRRRYTLIGKQWYKTELTWTLRTPSRFTSRLDTGTIRQQITAATLLWQKKSALRFIEVHKEAKDIDIYIDFVVGEHGDAYAFDGKGKTLAHAFYPGIGRGGDMHFDDEDNFVHHHQREKGNSLLITAAHELGHSLGISHSDVNTALMAPYYQDFPDDFELPNDDVRAIQAMYGPPEEDPRPPIPTQRPRRTTTTTTTTTRPPRPRPRPPVRTTTTTRPPRPPPRPPKPPPRPPKPPIRPPRPPTRPPRPPIRPPTPHPRPTTTPRPPTEGICQPSKPSQPDRPDICFSDIDAVTSFRNELFFFKGEYYWRLDRKGRPYWREYPEKIALRFPPLSEVDAAYVNPNGDLVLFQGQEFFILGDRLEVTRRGYLSHLNINATHLNAAMLWGHNGRAYVFSEDRYWRLGKSGAADIDYPRDIATWRGVPKNVSAVFTLGYKTFFLSGLMYWVYDNKAMRAQQTPLVTAAHWLTCPKYTEEDLIKCFSGQDKLRGSNVFLLLLFSLLFSF